MSTAELIADKAKQLSETELESVLAYIERLQDAAPSARELRQMPRAERDRILGGQAAEAEPHYRQNPSLIVEDVDPPMDYESSDAR